jgi:hypothetical protein
VGEEKESAPSRLRLPGRLSELSVNVLGSLIASAILLVVTTSAITVAVTNNNTNTNTVGQGDAPDDESPPTTLASSPIPGRGNAIVSDSPPTSTFPVRFDPSEDGSTWISSNQSKFFFDRQFFVAVGQVSGTGSARVLSFMTLQEGTLAHCRFENVRPGRYFYRRSGREYEIQLDLPPGLGVADVNIAEWDGRKTYEEPCAGSAIEPQP